MAFPFLSRWCTPDEQAALKISCWVVSAGISLALWTRSIWALAFVICVCGALVQSYVTVLDIKLRHARGESETR